MHIAIPKPEPNPGYFFTSLHKANRCVKWIKVLTKVTERVLQKTRDLSGDGVSGAT